MNKVRSSIPHRRPLHQGRGAVVGSWVFAAVASLMCGGCGGGATSASAHPARLVLMVETQPVAQAAQALPPAPDPSPAVIGAEQPEGETPIVKFLGPRPPQFPFRMEFTEPPDPPDVIELSPVAPGEAIKDRLRHVLRAEFARYPSGTLGVVDDILVGGTLTHNGRSVGASYFLGLVFIATGEQDAGAQTDAHVVRAFHHEASSVLLHQHRTKFDEARFRAALPAGFVYRDDRPGANKEAPLAPDEDTVSLDLLNDGFLIPWAKRNLEQDFNSYAEVLLQRPGLLLELFAPESRIGKKARVVRDFYIAIDKRFETMFTPLPPGGK